MLRVLAETEGLRAVVAIMRTFSNGNSSAVIVHGRGRRNAKVGERVKREEEKGMRGSVQKVSTEVNGEGREKASERQKIRKSVVMLSVIHQGLSQLPWRLSAARSNGSEGKRSLWSFLKEPEAVEKLAELDASEPLIQNLSPERAIASVKRLTPEEFHNQYRLPSKPVILKGIANTWAAGAKWKDPRYFATHFGKSSVPIEVNGHYLQSNWTQKMVSFKDFIEKYITLENKSVILNFLLHLKLTHFF